ncbi:MAG: DNA (cytosine-5-)-methyltransferase [Paludibacteraceae bacterium]|nr:DNA (cytosine-5-)-methyltransferase [Paludibacteraceae bacterium]
MIKQYKIENEEINIDSLCEPLLDYCKVTQQHMQLRLFPDEEVETNANDVRVIELFAGVGGFRIGLERASSHYKTVWNNQWEPSTKRQDASIIYQKRFGTAGHSNLDISTVPVEDIPNGDLLVGGFPCQDYSVATTLKNSGGIEGKKGVLWWQIYRILKTHTKAPKYLFLENVDRLLKSPATQRGRDFAIILQSLSELGYIVEWRVINAAEYGMPQRRRRTYIVAYKNDTAIARNINDPWRWIKDDGTIAKAFPMKDTYSDISDFVIEGNLQEVSDNFNKGHKDSPFGECGIMINSHVYSFDYEPLYNGPRINLGDILINEKDVPDEFFIKPEDLSQWQYLKGSKSEKRVNKATGFEYNYSEGSMAFPDFLDRPSRTIITGEGGAGASRFKHVILTSSGRYRRLTPVELERLNMFPDNHTHEASEMRRAFLMGNALVTGIIERIGLSLIAKIH